MLFDAEPLNTFHEPVSDIVIALLGAQSTGCGIPPLEDDLRQTVQQLKRIDPRHLAVYSGHPAMFLDVMHLIALAHWNSSKDVLESISGLELHPTLRSVCTPDGWARFSNLLFGYQ